jgi:hypothetical protein
VRLAILRQQFDYMCQTLLAGADRIQVDMKDRRSPHGASIPGILPHSTEKARLGLIDRVHNQRAIKEQISGFATRLCNQQTSVAGRSMQCSIIMGKRWIVVRADRIAGTEALSIPGRT